MKVRAMFIDMDGTLLTAKNNISRRNTEAINKLMNQGVKVFLATGRHYDVTVPYHKQLGLQTPMICLNGASIHDAITGKVMQMKPVKLDEDRFLRLTAEIPCNVLIHASNGLYCKEMNEEIESWITEGQISPRYIGDLRNANYPDVLKYSVRTGIPCPEFSVLFKDEADVIDWHDGFEIVSRGVSKWSAIETLLHAFGINTDEVVTIGDGPNDIQMLQHAGMGVAMDNASDAVKEVADFITGHHQNDGLAAFIEQHLIHSYSI
ncbi:Cof-type HAD-IIB family hydrolase [Ornithinibacillus sp. L9]|uniref:Cof-type HAD-IIB family hydrolase n=1 Tax=Ornithinibacillus caprae TaxID=2678566 RepID=A0A6N8FDY4_9BACI|nr:HAD family hydrolase [Ornithinibacillus caprae]MUK87743.1 Cof-type HAD-IIB family hydrolase [Ornithinibacillus caprae]